MASRFNWPLLFCMMHTVYAAQTRYGKTEYIRKLLLEGTRRRRFGWMYLDPPGSGIKKLLLDPEKMGGFEDVVVFWLNDTDVTLQVEWFTPSTKEDWLERRKENEANREKFKSKLLFRRGMLNTALTPIIEQGLNYAIDLLLWQDQPCPAYWILRAFEPDSPEQQYLLAHCTNENVVRQIMIWNASAPKIRDDKTGPAFRILDGYFGKTCVLAHTAAPGQGFDIRQWIRDGKIILVSGEGLEDDASSVLEMSLMQIVFDEARKGGLRNDYLVVVDEATERVDLNIAKQCRESGKFRCWLHLIIQNPLDFRTPQIRNEVYGNTAHWWGRLGNPEAAQFAAEDIGTYLIDPMKIHFQESRERQEHDGYDIRDTESTGESKGPDGKKRKDVRHGDQALSKYRKVTDTVTHYKRYEDQITDVKKQIMGLDKGWYWTRGEKVLSQPAYFEMEKEPWASLESKNPLGLPRKSLRDSKLEKIIERLKQRPMYRRPVLLLAAFRAASGQSLGQFARLRNERMVDALSVMPMTANMTVQFGLYPSLRVANRRLRRLEQGGKCYAVGLVQLNDAGAKEILYSAYRVSSANVVHHGELSKFLKPFYGLADIVTGADVDQALLPDATLKYPVLVNDEWKTLTFHVEWDRGTMNYRQIVKERWPKYEGCTDPVLWIASTDKRRKGFIERASQVEYLKGIMLFTTARDAWEKPFEAVWSRWDGTKKRVPKPIPKPMP